MTARLRRVLVISASVVASLGAVADEPAAPVETSVPLPAEELRQITTSLIQRYPELAGSPGAKVAAAYLGGSGGSDGAAVIYYPHAQRHGIKQALQARCRRAHSTTTWTCHEVEIRRYVQLDSQDFEVRVVGELSSASALALIEASRRDLDARATEASVLPNTAVMITPHHGASGDYLVTWGTPEGMAQLTMHARLVHGADPAAPDSWRASIFETAAEQ